MTLPGPAPWTTELATGWVAELVGDLLPRVEVVAGPKPPQRGRMLVVTLSPSAGPDWMDGLGESPAFQVRAVGGANNLGDAEHIARAADRAIKFAAFPRWIGDVRLRSVRRLGSPPSPLSTTPDAGGRFSFVATYITDIL